MKQIQVNGLVKVKPMSEMLAERSALVRSMPRAPDDKLEECYAMDFPVRGGWGYTQEDACVFDFGNKFDGCSEERRMSLAEGIGVHCEYLFFERRVYEEIIHHPLPDTPDLHCLRWERARQALIHGEDGRRYDKLEFKVTGFLEDDLEFLKRDAAECMSRNDIDGIRRNREMALERMYFYNSVCWFDVTSFYKRPAHRG